MITEPEFMRRMKEMQMMQGMDNDKRLGIIHKCGDQHQSPYHSQQIIVWKQRKTRDGILSPPSGTAANKICWKEKIWPTCQRKV